MGSSSLTGATLPVLTEGSVSRSPSQSYENAPDDQCDAEQDIRCHRGEVLDMLVQSRRDSRAALRLMRKLLRKQGFVPKLLVTDKLRSYGSAFRQLQLTCPHEQGSGKTIVPRIRISPYGDESARCSGSNRLDLPSASSARIGAAARLPAWLQTHYALWQPNSCRPGPALWTWCGFSRARPHRQHRGGGSGDW